MKIDKVTITGADDRTSYNDLLTLQEDFPFVEWGILFSNSKEGEFRYPSAAHRKAQFIGELNLSAHFCGWWAKQVLEKQNFKLISDLPKQYKRIQINYNFEHGITESATQWSLEALAEFVDSSFDRRIILQYNKSNKLFIDSALSLYDMSSKIHLLYDSSGGRGTEIKKIQPSIGGHYTGYAGGITIDNLDSICCDIIRVKDAATVWVDLESGARTNNVFDLELVRALLEKFSLHVNRK